MIAKLIVRLIYRASGCIKALLIESICAFKADSSSEGLLGHPISISSRDMLIINYEIKYPDGMTKRPADTKRKFDG